jgi:flagellin
MSLGILNNLSAVYAENNLNNTNNSLNTVLQQLSSGSKINSGADDAAGLSLVNGLQANQQALVQSKTNASEGEGLLQVADGALSQVTSLLNRAVTLATESANGTLNATQDQAANQEYQSILSEISNIGSTTTYNQEQVFNSNTNIYTGDASAAGSAVDALNIRGLSSSNVGDSNGVMAYSNGQNNVFIDLSDAGQNAAVTDSLGKSTATTTIAVGYLTQGSGGAAVSATANISVGAGTNYANTAQGLINAINNSGLGISASFGTATQAGTGAATSALQGGYVNSAALTNGTDTGIIISGKNVGVNTESTSATGVYTNGVGGVGTITVSQVNDTLSGTLNVTDSSGKTHALTLGSANSTDTLQNLMSTINNSGWGVTASLNSATTTNVTGAADTHVAGTMLTLTSANPNVTVTGTGITDNKATTITANTTFATATSAGAAANGTDTVASITVNAATDTLSGLLTVTGDGTTGNFALGVSGTSDTLANLNTYINANNAAGIFKNLSSSVSGGTLTVWQTAKTANYVGVATETGSKVQDQAATTGNVVVAQTAALATATAVNTTFGTITVSNANDTLSGTLNVADVNTTAGTAITLGNSGTTDNLTDLAAYINNTLDSGSGTSKITAVLNTAGTQIQLQNTTSAAGSADDAVFGTSIATSLSLTGTPTAAGSTSSTILGTLALPVGGSAGDVLNTGKTLIIGSNTINLGVTTGNDKTDTMADLAATINNGNYGVTATLNNAGTSITFTTANSDIPALSTTAPSTTGTDKSDANGTLTYTTFNQGVTASAYYSVGISSANGVTDSSTGGGTAVNGLAYSSNGAGTGVATISYSDGTGQNLASTDLSSSGDAQSALTSLNSAIADVAAQDGYIGAQINTLSSVSQVLSTQQENVQSAQNAVQATDYAQASSNMSKYEILSQTGIAALAQANSQQQAVLKLLQ